MNIFFHCQQLELLSILWRCPNGVAQTMPQHTKQSSKHDTSDNVSGGNIEDGVEGTADADTTAFISLPSSKFPSMRPQKINGMANHNEQSYDKGYDSEGKLLYFYLIGDLGENSEKYYENSTKIRAPPKDPPTLIAKETTPSNQYRLNSYTVEAAN